MAQSKHELLLQPLLEAVRTHYGERLISVVLFGSVARESAGPGSDVDILIVADPLPQGRLKRVAEFEVVESALAGPLAELARDGMDVLLSPVFKTSEEVRLGSPLFLDMVREGRILFDRDDFMHKYLEALRASLEALGARRVEYRGSWYWDLKPGYRKGDVIDL